MLTLAGALSNNSVLRRSAAHHQQLQIGEFLLAGTGFCWSTRCSNAGFGEYYTSIGSTSGYANDEGDCSLAPCDPTLLDYDQFFTLGWINASSSCTDLVADCPQRGKVPAGYHFDDRVVCTLRKCPAPDPGRYFDGRGECSTDVCTNEHGPDHAFSEGWTDKQQGCPVQRCPARRPGTYSVGGCALANCTKAPVSGRWWGQRDE